LIVEGSHSRNHAGAGGVFQKLRFDVEHVIAGGFHRTSETSISL
jgi:hypothetical protein